MNHATSLRRRRKRAVPAPRPDTAPHPSWSGISIAASDKLPPDQFWSRLGI